MKLGIGSDHIGYRMKLLIKQYLLDCGHEVEEYGCVSEEPVDYPVYGERVAQAVATGEVEGGVLICGTGIGISLAANKVPGVRAAACSEAYSASMAKRHNNANVIAFGARVVGPEVAKAIVDAWLSASFERGIHQDRVEMLSRIERTAKI